MTAINPAKLKIHCAELSAYYDVPAKFISKLHDILGFYGARIRQTSLSHNPLTLQSYQVPVPVLHTLVNELKELFNSEPDLGLDLIDALWKEEWVEFRQLAILCLGDLPAEKPAIILDRISSWVETGSTEDIRRSCMTQGIRRLSAEKPEAVIAFLEELISSGTKMNLQAALYGLTSFSENPDFDNLPVIYKLLAEILQTEETGLVKEITSLLRILGKRSEQESAYFLERQLAAAAKPRIFRITRQVIGQFSPNNQNMLRDALDKYQ